MQKREEIVGAFFLIVLATLCGSTAEAQFLGDVFFQEPSVAIPQGETGEVEVVLFAGAEPVGGYHIDVTFDPGSLRIETAETATLEFAQTLVFDTEPGRLSIAAVNSESLDGPFGTVSLAKVRLTPLGSSGSRSDLQIVVRALLQPDRSAIAGQGFSGEILVLPAGTPPSTKELLTEPSFSLEERASKMARPGSEISLVDLGPDGSLVRRQVRVPAQQSVVGSEQPDSLSYK